MTPLSQSAPEPRFGRSVSIDQAAQLLNVSRRTIYYRIREGRLLTIRIGGSQRVLVESLQQGSRVQTLAPHAPSMLSPLGNPPSRHA